MLLKTGMVLNNTQEKLCLSESIQQVNSLCKLIHPWLIGKVKEKPAVKEQTLSHWSFRKLKKGNGIIVQGHKK